MTPEPRAAVERRAGPYDSGIVHHSVPRHPLVSFSILGKAAPAGSKSAFALRRKDGSMVTRPDGSPIINVTDASKRAKPWQAAVREAAEEAYDGPVVDCPLAVTITFVEERGSSHYRSGASTSHLLARAARLLPTVKPDVLKLARGVEDALTGVLWRDDSLIVEETLRKRYGAPARCEVEVEFMEHATVADYEDYHAAQQALDVAA